MKEDWKEADGSKVGTMKAILHILEHDFKRFTRYKWWIAGLITMNLADLFVMAVVYTRMVNTDVMPYNYFEFFAPGITITALFAAAFMIGREINMEVRQSVSHYMLSLPMTRLELGVGRMLSGGLRGMVYMSSLLLINFIFLGFPTVIQLLVILGALFLIATGTSGLSIAMAVSTKSFERFVTMRGVLYYMLFFCSTVFYPLHLIEGILPRPLVLFAQFNPLSCGADLIRVYLIPDYPPPTLFFSSLVRPYGSYRVYLIPDYPPFTLGLFQNLVIFSLLFTLIGALAYVKIIESE